VSNDDAVLRDVLLKELEHRREKQWKIFSWIAGLLVAMIGGTAALKLREMPGDFTRAFKLAIAGAGSGLWLYAVVWIRQNWRLELKVLDKLHDMGIDLPTNDRREKYLGQRKVGLVFGYLQALFFVYLALLAVVAMRLSAA
jgi:hypothetical protein